MATRANTVAYRGNNQVVTVTWTGLLNTDDGAPVDFATYLGKTFHATGTFGAGGTVALEGSNDGTNWAPLANSAGSAATLTSSAAMNQSTYLPLFVRPRVSAGDGTTSLTVVMSAYNEAPGGGR